MADQSLFAKIFRMMIPPGIWRDYSSFSSLGVTEAQWFRWYHQRLKKIGGFKFIAGLKTFSLNADFTPNDSPEGNPNTEPSYPAIQYIDQDLLHPYDANFIDYESYNYTSGVPATYYNGAGIDNSGYRTPRKIINVVLDGVNQLIVAADYSQPVDSTTIKYGGVAFGGLLNDPSLTNLVDGFFPARFSDTGLIPGYRPNNTYVWSLEFVNLTLGQESANTSTYIVVHPSCQSGITDPTNNYVYIIAANNLVNNAVLAPLSQLSPVENLVANSEVLVSGGVCAVGPFLFAYGNNGLIRNSDANNPLYWVNGSSPAWNYLPQLTNDTNVCNSKIVKGISYRGTSSYAALFWSLDSLILATFQGAPAVWNYTVLFTNISIIAPNSVIERSGEYYWIGDGRFFRFAGGQLSEIPNLQNRNWFFSNVNKNREHLIWGSLNPQYNEVWWFFPFGNSQECNRALIYNYEENCWYDTTIDRSAGVYSSVFGVPVWASNIPTRDGNQYEVFVQETGTDYITQNNTAVAIYSSFVTPDLGYLSTATPGSPKSQSELIQNWSHLLKVEPDGIISGEWSMAIESRRYANSIPEEKFTQSFTNKVTTVDTNIQGRILQLRIWNQGIDSDFYLGNFMLTIRPGDSEGF